MNQIFVFFVTNSAELKICLNWFHKRNFDPEPSNLSVLEIFTTMKQFSFWLGCLFKSKSLKQSVTLK